LLTATLSNSTIRDTQSSPVGSDGVEIALLGSSEMDLDVTGSVFDGNRTNGLQLLVEGSAVANTVDITGNEFDPGTGIGLGINLAANDAAQMNFNIDNNLRIYSHGGTAVNVVGFGNSTGQGRITNNADIQTNRNGGGGGTGISVGAEDASNFVVDISNNSISNIFQDNGITAFARAGTGRLDATIGNNTVVLQAGLAIPLYGIEVRAQNDNTACANVSNNAVTLGSGSAAFRERTSNPGSTVLLEGFTTTATAVWNGNGNTPLNSVSDSNSGTLGAPAAPGCATVVLPLP
jgi:hypothetical protein